MALLLVTEQWTGTALAWLLRKVTGKKLLLVMRKQMELVLGLLLALVTETWMVGAFVKPECKRTRL